MDVVIDTNEFLISLPTKSHYRPIFDSLINGDFSLMVSNDIVSEYFEIIERKTSTKIANNVIGLLLSLPNVFKTEIYFKWTFITEDYDDNKFVDCTISSGAKYIVSNDRYFNDLKQIEFPKVEVLTDGEFLKVLTNENN